MAITQVWDNPEKTVICVTYGADWSWEEMYTNAPLAGAMLDSVNHTVHSIQDMSNAPSVPNGGMGSIKHFPNISKMPMMTHPNAGLMVFVGSSKLVGMLTGALAKAFNLEHVRFATTLDEAYAVIAEQG